VSEPMGNKTVTRDCSAEVHLNYALLPVETHMGRAHKGGNVSGVKDHIGRTLGCTVMSRLQKAFAPSVSERLLWSIKSWVVAVRRLPICRSCMFAKAYRSKSVVCRRLRGELPSLRSRASGVFTAAAPSAPSRGMAHVMWESPWSGITWSRIVILRTTGWRIS